MKEQITSTVRKDCETKAALVAAVGTGMALRGCQLLMAGYETADPALKENGMRTLFAGIGIVPFAPLVRDGILSVEQLMELLEAR